MERVPRDLRAQLQSYLPDDPVPLGATPAYGGTFLQRLPKTAREQLQGYVRRCGKITVHTNIGLYERPGIMIRGADMRIFLPITKIANRRTTIAQLAQAVEVGDEAHHVLNENLTLYLYEGVFHPDTKQRGGRIFTEPQVYIPACHEVLVAIAEVERHVDRM